MEVVEGLTAAGGTTGVGASGSDAEGGPAGTGIVGLMVGFVDGWVEGVWRDAVWASTEAGNTEGTIRARRNAGTGIALRMARPLFNPYLFKHGWREEVFLHPYLFLICLVTRTVAGYLIVAPRRVCLPLGLSI